MKSVYKWCALFCRAVASRWLTIILMAVSAVVMAFFTGFEAYEKTGEVPYRLYLSPPFIALLALVFFNLLFRLFLPPFRRLKQLPSLLLHAGFVLILFGGYITWTCGLRGSVSLFEGQSVSFFFVDRPVLHVGTDAQDSEEGTADAASSGRSFLITPNGTFTTGSLLNALTIFSFGRNRIEAGDEEIDILDTEGSVRLLVEARRRTEGDPASVLTFAMGSKTPGAITLQAGDWAPVEHAYFSRIVFGAASSADAAASLMERACGNWITIRTRRGGSVVFPVSIPGDVGKTFVKQGYRVEVVEYHPDFKMGRAPSPDDTPENPALKLTVTTRFETKTVHAFALHPDFDGMHGSRFSDGTRVFFSLPKKEKVLVVAAEENGRFLARIAGNPKHYTFSDEVPLVLPDTTGKSPPAFKVRIGAEGTPGWLCFGSEPVFSADRSVKALVDNRYPLGFEVTLHDAVSKFWPASQIPRVYYSLVSIREDGEDAEKQKDKASKETQRIETNHPLYHEGFRFYQTNMNRQATNSGFSVTLDPGVPFVTAGFCLLFGGFLWLYAVRFVLRRLPRRRRKEEASR